MKLCSKCKIGKTRDEFFFRKGATDGLRSHCKECTKESSKRWRRTHSDQVKTKVKEWTSNNIEKVNSYHKEWELLNRTTRNAYKRVRYASSPEYDRARRKIWYSNNKEKCYNYSAVRRALKQRAIPIWSKVWIEKLQIEELYLIAKTKSIVTSIPYQVDHIVPLNSDIVQGFHCLSNMQILSLKENLFKGNRVWPDMP